MCFVCVCLLERPCLLALWGRLPRCVDGDWNCRYTDRQAAAAYHPSIHLLPQLGNLIKNYCPHDTDQFPSSFIFRIIGMSEDWDHLSLTLGHLVQSLPPPKLDRLLFTCQIRSAPGADCPPTSSIVLPPHHHHLFNGSPSRSRDFNLYLPHSVSQAQAQAQAQLKRGASN